MKTNDEWLEDLGFYLYRDTRDEWLVSDGGDLLRAASVEERVLWKELTGTPAAPGPLTDEQIAQIAVEVVDTLPLEELDTPTEWVFSGAGLAAVVRECIERAHGITKTATPAASVAHVSECEACMTPDTCQLRGTCDHYAAERLRVAAPAAPVAQPLTDDRLTELWHLTAEIVPLYAHHRHFARAIERAHGIGREGGAS